MTHDLPPLKYMPDCMIGPSEPCKGYQELHAAIAPYKAEIERLQYEVVNRNRRALDGDQAKANWDAEYERAEKAEAERDAIKLQAQSHSMEARTANATIAEIYQLCTGATGEPGNWNGAEPVRKLIAENAKLKEENENLRREILALRR